MRSTIENSPTTTPRARPSVVRLTPAGFGLVRLCDGEAFVGAKALGPALDGDEVELEIIGSTGMGARARVLRVIKRNPQRLCGITDAGGGFVADDARVHRPLRCDVGRASWGAPAIVYGGELLPASEADAELRIARRFGPRGTPQAEEDAILWREELAEAFPEAALREAEATARAGRRNWHGRSDLRQLGFITIDPASAEDHDDAVFATKIDDDRTQVCVAISDVSAFVPEGSALDLEARRRGASLYFPRRVVPMLPPLLSNDVASLLPNVDRPAVVLELQLDAERRVVSRRLVQSRIRSRGRLSYEDVAEVLQSSGVRGSEVARSQAEMLLLLDAIARDLRAARVARGAVIIEAAETVIETDAEGMPVQITRTAPTAEVARAHHLVEELMLLANETVGDMLRQQGQGILFRSHEPPSELRARGVIEAARRAGIEIDDEVALDPARLRDLVKDVPDAALRAELSALLLEALPTALYASGREDHFALASSHYVHFTSPIRRYADLTIHREIVAMLQGDASSSATDPELVNLTMRRARAIQREVGELYAALLMQCHLGREYTGTLAHVGKRHCFVALQTPAISVRCPRPLGQQAVGTQVNVRIENVSIARRLVEATLLGDGGPS